MPTPERHNLRGIAWMLVDAFVMSGLLMCGKLLGARAMSPLVVVCLTNVVATLGGIAVAASGRRLSQVRPRRPLLHLERAVLGIASTSCLLAALHSLSLYEAGAFNLLIPVITSGGAVLVWRERAHAMLGLSLMVAVAGVALLLVAQNPGAGLPRPVLRGVGLCAASVGFAVLNNLNQKRIGTQERLEAQRVFGPLFSALLSLPAAWWLWQSPDLASLGLVGAYGVLLTVRLSTRFRAFRDADVSVLMPFEYTQLLWSALWSALCFGQGVTALGAAGMALVVGGGALLLRSEARRVPTGKPAPGEGR
jgi:drug/metabolite transporter (DMT)-like permease